VFAVGEDVEVMRKGLGSTEVSGVDLAIAGVVDEVHANAVKVLDQQEILGLGEPIVEVGLACGDIGWGHGGVVGGFTFCVGFRFAAPNLRWMVTGYDN
jgi:hypothetical protein